MHVDIYHGPRPLREIRAVYDERIVRVYQAFEPEIALPALEAQTFVPPFRFALSWASWIKPSFLWMMARTSWGSYTRLGNNMGLPENLGRTFVLGIDVTREFFDRMLRLGRLTHFPLGFDKKLWKERMKSAQVYIQWDPEKDLYGGKRPWKTIQIGLKTAVLRDYADSIVRITDMGDLIREIKETSNNSRRIDLLPDERPYPLMPADDM